MFIPGSNEPATLDRAMRNSLASSLTYLISEYGTRLNVAACYADATIANIRKHTVKPAAFGRYYKLVVAIKKRDLVYARNLVRELGSSVENEAAFSIRAFTDTALGDDWQLYADLIDPDPGNTPWIVPPSKREDQALILKALEMLDVADPNLAREVRGLIVQVVEASSSACTDARGFGSVSSLMLWGLAMVNQDLYQTPARMLQALVHEAAHLLLYAHSIDEPLVTNPIDARYLSPLREDARPMDGVFHATFVIARLHYVAKKMLEATSLDLTPGEICAFEGRLVMARERFFGGYETIRKHGQLTNTGQRILHESLEYMTAG